MNNRDMAIMRRMREASKVKEQKEARELYQALKEGLVSWGDFTEYQAILIRQIGESRDWC